MSKKKEDVSFELAALRKLLPRGTTVYTVLAHVSSNGMSRRLKLMVPLVETQPDYSKPPKTITTPEGETITVRKNVKVNVIRDITWYAGKVLGHKVNDRHELTVSGCGMDMGFAVVYDLASTLYAEDRKKKGYGTGASKLGGYALEQKWL